MKEQTTIDLLGELTTLAEEVIRELFNEEVRPIIKHTEEVNRKIGEKEIRELHELEDEARR